jgi:hypothetical protein
MHKLITVGYARRQQLDVPRDEFRTALVWDFEP